MADVLERGPVRMFLNGTGGVFLAAALGWWAILFLFGMALLLAALDLRT